MEKSKTLEDLQKSTGMDEKQIATRISLLRSNGVHLKTLTQLGLTTGRTGGIDADALNDLLKTMPNIKAKKEELPQPKKGKK